MSNDKSNQTLTEEDELVIKDLDDTIRAYKEILKNHAKQYADQIRELQNLANIDVNKK